MIERLRVRNLAVVEDATVTFEPGLNVVTGETGAGKSILIGAIELLRGCRAGRSIIRAGSDQCVVEALLRPPDLSRIERLLDDAGLPPCEDGLLVVRRIVAANGQSRCLLNDAATTAQTLRLVGERLVDLHGPHDNQSLFDPGFQLGVLDALGGHDELAGTYRECHRQRQALLQRRAGLAGDDAAVARELDLLAYQTDEIRGAQLTAEDGEPLTRRHADAAHAEQLIELGRQATTLLVEGEPSMLDLLGTVQHALSDMARLLGDEAAAWRDEARGLAVQVQALARAIEDRLETVDASPERLAAIDARMSLVQRLLRKYGGSVEAVLAFGEDAAQRLEALRSRDVRRAALDDELARLQPRLQKAADALSDIRRGTASRLRKAIDRELRDLGFRDARFEIGLSPCEPGPSGCDRVEFGFAPNPGEPPRALREIASSGEIARVMLALKTVLADHDRVPTLVFDEIDANIGGEIGNAVGAKMRTIGDRGHQVLCITHLPQVAAYGRAHRVVVKTVEANRTQVRIHAVEQEDRIREIARMLGGAERTSLALDHARELLERV